MNFEEERKEILKKITTSTASRKLILAGPGCGKTFTFKELLKLQSATPEDSLSITFINVLTDDLRTKLEGLADVRTFHSLAKHLLHKNGLGDFELFPELENLIRTDYLILTGKIPPENFNTFFRELKIGNETDFFLKRGDYYRSASYDDIVYRVLKISEEQNKPIANFKMIVVDEYQDFNLLEVSFIDKVINSQTVVLAGDDDQALYEDFRSSSPDFIIAKTKDTSYATFKLPFCNRCTKIIVQAVSEVISKATEKGLLSKRIAKDFICYLPKKERESALFPKIVHATITSNTKKAPYVGRYILDEIQKITEEEIKEAKSEGYYDAVIIGKGHYLEKVASYLRENNIPFEYKKSVQPSEVENVLYALLSILKINEKSNLGWRILMEFEKPSNFEEIIIKSEKEDDIFNLLERSYKEKYINSISLITELIEKKQLTDENWKILESLFKTPRDEILAFISEIQDKTEQKLVSDKPTIKLTSFLGAKGLSAGRVFVISFNNGDFPRNPNSITELEVKKFIVALSRTVKKCYLISNMRDFTGKFYLQPSEFLNWLNLSSIENIKVNKEYLK